MHYDYGLLVIEFILSDILKREKSMGSTGYKQTLDQLRKRYSEVLQGRRAMEQELANLTKTIEGLAALCGEEPNIPKREDSIGTEAAKLLAESWLRYLPFADAVRNGLRIVAPIALTTSELRVLITRAGYPMHTKTDPMVSLNVALRRLLESEEVEIVDKDNRKAYRWAFKNEMTPPPGLRPKLDWEALLRTANEFGYEIALGYPEAADDRFEPEKAPKEKK